MKNQLIHKNIDKKFDIAGDKELFEKIIADQEQFAGKLRPEKNWDLDIGGHGGQEFFYSKLKGESVQVEKYSDEAYSVKFSSLKKMLEPLIGCSGLKKIDQNIVDKYFSFLKIIDHIGITENYFSSDGLIRENAGDLLITDLGSMIDLNLITFYLNEDLESYSILEVGGGYGRLVEVLYKFLPNKKFKYVMIDSVPASLMYAYLYLKKNLPKIKIGFFYNDDPFDLSRYDCFIIPAWHFRIEEFEDSFNCCVNIQSMQEMNQFHVDYYLNMFNQILKVSKGIAYISNEKDYIFRGEWNYPKNWECLLKTRTPRSWTRNSPTEIYLKTGDNQQIKNNYSFELLYNLQLVEFDRISEQQDKLINQYSTIKNLHDQIDELKNQIKNKSDQKN